MSTPRTDSTAHRGFGRALDELGHEERRALEQSERRGLVSRDVNRQFRERLTFGERLADRVASFGGSWTFIICFALVLLSWAVPNTRVLSPAFDPYPFIFLNLLLSMLAAVQAPLIMMSQNRQASKDRLDAAHDHEVDIKAELEIMALPEKLDALRGEQLAELLRAPQRQIELLTVLVDGLRRDGARGAG